MNWLDTLTTSVGNVEMIPACGSVTVKILQTTWIENGCQPVSGSNSPPLTMVDRKVDAARLNDPSGSVFIFAISDCCDVSVELMVVAD